MADDVKRDENDSRPKKASILEDLQSQHLLFHDTTGSPYIAINKTGATVISLESREFQKWLRMYLRKKHKRVDFTHSFIDEITQYAISVAEYDGPEKQLGVRLFRKNDQWGCPERIGYDLRDGSAVNITRNGWSITEEPEVEFYQFQHQYPQAKPKKTNSYNLNALRKFVRVTDKNEWLMLQVFAVSMFVPDYPKPIVSMTGDMGAGKTESLRTLCKLLDPSELANGTAITYDTEEIMRRCTKSAILFVDNVDSLSKKLMSALCIISTGGSIQRRKLYSNNDDWTCYIQRPVLLSSITEVSTRADLLDRSLIFNVARIPEKDRKPKAELDAEFASAKPEILGAIFNILSKALEILPNVQLDKYGRLADFHALGYAITEAMDGYKGEDFNKAFEAMRKKQDEQALEASPVAQAAQLLIQYNAENGWWLGTPTEFYDLDIKSDYGQANSALDRKFEITSNPEWPRTVSALGRELRRCHTTIERLGIQIEYDGFRNGQRFIKLTDMNHKNYKENNTNGQN